MEWTTLGGPAQINDGIISGAIDVGAVGLPNLITLWEKTRTNVKVRAIAGLNFMPLLLVTRDPKIKALKDYSEKDRIAGFAMGVDQVSAHQCFAVTRGEGMEAAERQ